MKTFKESAGLDGEDEGTQNAKNLDAIDAIENQLGVIAANTKIIYFLSLS